MVRQRKQPQDADRGSSSPRRKPAAAAASARTSTAAATASSNSKPAPGTNQEKPADGTGDGMQYVSNSRSRARQVDQTGAPSSSSLCRWLWRPKRTRFLVALVVLGGAGFVCGQALYHRVSPEVSPLPKSNQAGRDSHLLQHHGPPLQLMPVEVPGNVLLHHHKIAGHQQQHQQQQQQQQQAFHQHQALQAGQHQIKPQENGFHDPAAIQHRLAFEKRLAEQQQLLKQQQQQQPQHHQQQHQQQHPVQQPHQQQHPAQQPQQQQPQQQQQQPGKPAAAAAVVKNDAPSDVDDYPYHVIQTLTNTHKLPHLKTRFIECTKSILDKASVNLHFFFVVDEGSRKFVSEALQDITNQRIAKKKFQFHFIMVEDLAHQLALLVSMLQESVTGGHPYYQDAIFFLSVAIHRGILPNYVKRVVMLDTDLKFKEDIRQLFDHFGRFGANSVMGLAHEMQPVYRHLLSLYRSQHRGTRVGGPPPDGLTGFNSGVVLLDLERMRASDDYRGFLSAERVRQLATKYSFRGHLGDQDLFSLISLERADLFYVLPCSWNRQLCVWWRDKGYKDVFDQYYQCPGKINVYHGNCNTPIPH